MTVLCKLGDTNWNSVGKRQNVNFEPLPPRATLIGLNTTLYFSDIHIVNCDTGIGSFCGWQEIRDRLYGFAQKIRDK